jgi:hypothetical protein
MSPLILGIIIGAVGVILIQLLFHFGGAILEALFGGW